MSYHFDLYDRSLVVDGWENGIAQNPFDGTANLVNVNVTTVPGEASVAPSTASLMTAPRYSGITVNADTASLLSCLDSDVPNLEDNQAVFFSSSSITNLKTGLNFPYWVLSVSHTIGGNCTFKIVSSYSSGSRLTDLGLTGTATMNTFFPEFSSSQLSGGPSRGNLLNKNYTVQSAVGPHNWALDSTGQLWSDFMKTSVTSSWTYAGNFNDNNTTGRNGNGLAYWQPTNAVDNLRDGWILVFRDSGVDIGQIELQGAVVAGITWTGGWDIKTGGSAINILFSGSGAPHEAIVTPDNEIVFNDSQYVWGILQHFTGNNPSTFDPTNTATYDFFYSPIVSSNDIGMCLTYMNGLIYIGGIQNKIYNWDGSSISGANSQPPILLPENYVSSLITVNLNIYIFCGNRGIIYISNGAQVSVYQKIPDHISGTVQPVYVWGGANYVQNKLYIGVSVYSVDFSTIYSAYAGVWAIDLWKNVIYLANTLSDSAGIVSGIGVQTSIVVQKGASAPSGFRGYGLYMTWWDLSTNSSGIDASVATPYVANESFIETEIIPIGTFILPRTNTYGEYKLSKNLANGEKIQILYRTNMTDSYSSMFTDVATATYAPFSNQFPTSFQYAQWIQFKIILTSIATSPSYVRLKELRFAGITGPTLAQAVEMSV